MKKKSFKKIVLIIILIIFASIFIIPIIINESYKADSGYITLWDAKDLLSYFGTVLSAIGTIFIGIVAIYQNERLLKLEEIHSTPSLHIDIFKCKMQCFEEREFDLLLGLKNTTENVINIIDVSPLVLDNLSKRIEISFCKGWSSHYSILPHQTKEIDFFTEVGSKDRPIVSLSDFSSRKGFAQFQCEFSIKMHFVNSADTYTQDISFYLHISLSKEEDNREKYKLAIFDLENSITKDD